MLADRRGFTAFLAAPLRSYPGMDVTEKQRVNKTAHQRARNSYV